MAEHDLALQLGSCQVQAIANDKFLDVAQRKLTMEVIWYGGGWLCAWWEGCCADQALT